MHISSSSVHVDVESSFICLSLCLLHRLNMFLDEKLDLDFEMHTPCLI